MNKHVSKLLPVFLGLFLTVTGYTQETQIMYLSGTGNDNTISWDFFCTEGRNSGKWTTIPVPSNWELQGFGKYNYGHDKDSLRGKEKGLYKYRFKIPIGWSEKRVSIVFEGSMTDTEVKINGKLAGPVHQGSFYRFNYDITQLLKFGKENILEVSVSKHSANESVNKAERKCDFWILGGIFRPVFLEAKPKENIRRVAIDAKSGGEFKAIIYLDGINSDGELRCEILDENGKAVSQPFKTWVNKGSKMVSVTSEVQPVLNWSPESPVLYQAKFTLLSQDKEIHTFFQKFGFRTVEFRMRDGIYINGVRIKFKGVCRHSFWPSSGRTTSKTLSIADVQLMKDMNMNAVRMSHYPPDKHFLDVCDSLGLFVLNELAGWHNFYDTEVGSKLVKEMVARDVNHPSVVIWDNGNEGGHNFDLDSVFDREDIQRRPVIHPWQNFRGIDNQHYRDYDYGNGSYFHGHDVFFPTEFLHGLYDGGLGSGLYDYWEAMWNNPLSAGGFLWVFSDEGIVRTDKNGMIDTDGSHAPDGILGPYREKEASFFTIKEVWSPIKFLHREITPQFNGIFEIENRYFYTNIEQCSFTWKLVKFPGPDSKMKSTELTGKAVSPQIAPGLKGKLMVSLPDGFIHYDVLYITAHDKNGHEILTWSWPISRPSVKADEIVTKTGNSKVLTEQTDSVLLVKSNMVTWIFNKKTGMLQQVKNNYGIIPLSNGPILCEGENDFKEYNLKYEGDNLTITGTFGKNSSFKSLVWTIYPSGWIKLDIQYCMISEEPSLMGISFSYPENLVTSATWYGDGPYRVWKNRIHGNMLGLWNKDYNNTVTGESETLKYPEFKGFHSRLYWVNIRTKEQPFTIVSANEDVFLHLFTPQSPKETFNVSPLFPAGNLSFLHGITPIGTKGQKPINLGPSGKKNMYFDYWKGRPKSLILYFDFRGE